MFQMDEGDSSVLGSTASGAAAGSSFGPWGTVIGAGVGLLGGMLANKSSAKEAEKSRSFQEDLSNTSYQRAVADMKAAGINPMLVTKVGGASTPAGATASQIDPIAPAVNSALRVQEQQVNLANAQKTGAEIDSRTRLNNVNAQVQLAQIGATQAGEAHSIASAAQLKEQKLLTQQLLLESSARVRNVENESDYRRKLMEEVDAKIDHMAVDIGLKRALKMQAMAQVFNLSSSGMLNLAHELESTERRRAFVQGRPERERKAEMFSGTFGSALPYVPYAADVIGSASSLRRMFSGY